MTRLRRTAVALVSGFLAACGGGGGGGDGGGDAAVALQSVATGLSFPLDLTAARSDPTRLYVAEKGGGVRVIRDGTLLSAPFLDLSGQVSGGDEQGLLGIVFHPDYPTDPRFFVNYTDTAGDTVIASYRRSAGDADRADPASVAVILRVDQPFANHNGGGLAFGPDGFLYLALGDGGSANDPQGNAQDLGTVLGKILRLDVDGTAPYAIPSSNPFAGAAARGEIWAYGLRNPFRFSFDRANGDLYIGDVGQQQREEVDYAPGSSDGGENYGWVRTEGTLCVGGGTCDTSGIVLPITEYDHGDGCVVTGGYVYRGDAIPDLRGTYFYGDFCSGFVRSLRVSGGEAVAEREWPELAPGGSITSFGEDAAGELYIVVAGGTIFRVVPAP